MILYISSYMEIKPPFIFRTCH